MIAYEPVQHTAGLLRIHQVHVDGASVLHCVLYGVFGDLMKFNAVLGGVVKPQIIGQMIADNLSLAVRVGCQYYLIFAFHFLLELVQKLFFALYRLVFRLKAVFDINT